MNRFNSILSVVLVVQLALAALLLIGDRSAADESRDAPLVGVPTASIRQIEIVEAGQDPLHLLQQDGRWRLPDLHDLAAQDTRVDALLQSLNTTRSGWPVTTTSASHERFKVADDNYARRVSLTSENGDTRRLYLGTSPGFRQLHVRREGEDEVYVVRLDSVDFAATGNDWFDRSVLKLSQPVDRMESGDIALLRADGNWVFEGRTEAVNSSAADALSTTLKDLSVTAVTHSIDADSVADLTVQSGDAQYRYRLYEHDGSRYLKRDDRDLYFRIAQADYATLSGLSLQSLAATDPAQDDSGLSRNTASSPAEPNS